MKKLALFIVIVALGSSTLFASSTDKIETEQLREQIVKLLESAPFNVEEEISANIEFVLTKNSEIIITNVQSNNELVSMYVMNKLNYQKVSAVNTLKMKFYSMPLKIVRNF